MSAAAECLFIQETDSASANDRLWHHRLSSKDRVLREHVVCHNHQCNLVEVSVVATTHARLISDFFGFSHFLQSSSHFAKLKQAVTAHIQEAATIFVCQTMDQVQESTNTKYLDELTSMLLQARVYTTKAKKTGDAVGSDDTAGSANELSGFKKKLADFKTVWNGNLSSPAGTFQHYCYRAGPASSWCCRSDEESFARMAKTVCQARSGCA